MDSRCYKPIKRASLKSKGDVHEASDDNVDEDAGPMSSLAALLHTPPPPARKKPATPAVKSIDFASKRLIAGKKNAKRPFAESPASRDTPKSKRPKTRVVVDEVSDTPEELDDTPSKKSPKLSKHVKSVASFVERINRAGMFSSNAFDYTVLDATSL